MTFTRTIITRDRLIGCVLLLVLGVLMTLDTWTDVARIAWNDEEASHILLVPIVMAWLIWARRARARYCRIGSSWLGPVLIAVGGALSAFGFHNAIQWFWHAGAVIVLVGCVVAVLGTDLLLKYLPAFAVLVFLIPVPGMVRQQVAIPLQTASAQATQFIFDLAGVPVSRSGNVLMINGVQVAIAEACNGMRMVFSLALVSYAFAFGLPLKPGVRLVVLLASPVCAIAANVVRLIPTVWVYGSYPESVAAMFHDASGWLMLPIAFMAMVGVVRALRWALVPVTRYTLAYQ